MLAPLYCSCSNAIAVSALVGDDVEQDHFKAGIRGGAAIPEPITPEPITATLRITGI